jgi:hypothetical protein
MFVLSNIGSRRPLSKATGLAARPAGAIIPTNHTEKPLDGRNGDDVLISINVNRCGRPISWLRPTIEEGCAMALESIKAEIGLILETFSNPPHDRYELYMQLKEKLNEMRVFGMTPPDDLLEFEAALDEEFAMKQPEAPRPAK